MPDNQFLRDASGRLTFEMFKVSCEIYSPLCEAIAAAFDLLAHTQLIHSMDVIFQDYRRGEQIVGLEWDIWSGFIITAKTTDSEPLVQAIALWLLQSERLQATNSIE